MQIVIVQSTNTEQTVRLLYPGTWCGSGGPVYDHEELFEERVSAQQFFMSGEREAYWVRASGTSMEGAGICSGDWLRIDVNVSPSIGDIVIVSLRGEMVIRRLEEQNGHVVLSSEYARRKVRYRVQEQDGLHIVGRIAGVFRKY